MTVAIQPSGNHTSREHYRDTVETPVSLDAKRSLLDNEYMSLVALFPSLHAALWGVTPGQNDANVSKYMKIGAGDIVIFTRDQHVVASGTVALCFQNEALARDLWGEDNKGQTWELMYALTDVKDRNISYSLLRGAIGSKDGDNFMGFRVLDRAKSEGVLELLGMEIPTATWDLQPGDEVKRADLQREYGGGPYGGIEPSAKSPNILLFTNPYKKSAFGYNFDSPREDGTFTYTGDGQIGNQNPNEGGNKSILEHRRTRRALRLFESTKRQTIVRYIGEFELGYPEFGVEQALDANGQDRNVLVFNLVPVGVTEAIEATDSHPHLGSVNRRVSERGISLKHEKRVVASMTVAERLEIQLQDRYKKHLEKQGLDVATFEIRVPESGTALRPDLVDFTSREIIEIKFGTSRGYVREAIGQVLDYIYQITQINGEKWEPSILLPGRPSEDLVGLVSSLNIRLIWETSLESFSSTDDA